MTQEITDGAAVLTVGEIAKLLNVSYAHAYNLVTTGRVPGLLKDFRPLRVSKVKFEQWLASVQA